MLGRHAHQPAAGVRVGQPDHGHRGVGALPPPNQLFPGFLNINRTQDVAVSLTKVMGRHTMKAGFYNNHSYKAQNTGAGGVPNLGFQGYVNFGNDTNNPLDTGFGYANAAIGRVHAVPAAVEVRRRQHDLQQHRVLPAGQLEGEQPADARLRPALHAPAAAVRPVPADVELLPGPVAASAAPLLYVPGCSNGASSARATPQRAGTADRADLTAPGAANTQAAIGTVDPGHRQPDQRHPAGRRRHRGDDVHLAEAGARPALRRGLRPDRHAERSSSAAAAACSTTGRTGTPCSRFPATRRSRRRRTCATASCRRSAPASAPPACRR